MSYNYIAGQGNAMHYYESTERRRARLGGYVHGQALCGSGNGHQKTTDTTSKVTCKNCLQMLKDFKY